MIVLENFLTQHVLEPTRTRENQTSNILDLVLSKDPELVVSLEVLPPIGKSDHVVLKICTNIELTTPDPVNRETLRLDAGDYNKMRQNLNNINWPLRFEGKNVEEKWTIFKEVISKEVAENIPKRWKYRSDKPIWFNSTVTSSIKQKRNAWNKYRFCKTDKNYSDYKKARNHTNNVLKRERKHFEAKIANEVKTNQKSFWNYIKSKTKPKQEVERLTNETGNIITQ